jgi:hypothetical protein
VFGKPLGGFMGKFAVGGAPPGTAGLNLPLLARAILMVLGWRIRGRTWPHPFFERNTRVPIHPFTVLTSAQREALRPLCGPNPTACPDGPERTL